MTAVALDTIDEQELRDIHAQLTDLTAAERIERERWRGNIPADASATAAHIAEEKRRLRERARVLQDASTAGSAREQATSRAVLLLSQRTAEIAERLEALDARLDTLSERTTRIVAGLGLAGILLQLVELVIR